MSGRKRFHRLSRTGMTLVDGVVALAVLAVLTALLVPQFRTPSQEEQALQRNLQQLRDRIELHRFRHEGRLPGAGGTEADLVADLFRGKSKIIAPAGVRSQQDRMPANPINGKSSVLVSEANPCDGSTGWWYHPGTGELRANVAEPQHGAILSSL